MQTRQKSIQMCQANTISLKIPFKVQKPVQAQSYQYKIIKSHSNMSSQYILIQKSVQAWINRSNPIQICQINTSSFQNAFKVQNSVQSPKFRSKPKIHLCYWRIPTSSTRHIKNASKVCQSQYNHAHKLFKKSKGAKPQHPGFPRGPPPWY